VFVVLIVSSSINGACISEPVVGFAVKKVITILLVGETGGGKTAFLSLLVNMLCGRRADDLAVFHDPSNESNLPSSQSQTNDAVMYKFVTANDIRVQVLDTPGLADTRGPDQDAAHRASIVEAIRNRVNTIDAVIVVANGTQERLGVSTEYALAEIGSMFPRSIRENIGFMFTHVADPLSMNFCLSSLPYGLQDARTWTIQNPLAQFVKYKKYIAENRPQGEVEYLWSVILRNYDATVSTLIHFIHWVDSCKAQPTKAIQDLHDMTMAIDSEILNIFARILQQEERREDLNRLNVELRTSHQVLSTFCCIVDCRALLMG
jgi:hypothetical protein